MSKAIERLNEHDNRLDHIENQFVKYQDETRDNFVTSKEIREKAEEDLDKKIQKINQTISVSELLKPFGSAKKDKEKNPDAPKHHREFKDFPELIRFFYTEPFDLISELKHSSAQRVSILEAKFNSSMGDQFSEHQQKMDQLLEKINENRGEIENNIVNIEKLRQESDECLCKKIEEVAENLNKEMSGSGGSISDGIH